MLVPVSPSGTGNTFSALMRSAFADSHDDADYSAARKSAPVARVRWRAAVGLVITRAPMLAYPQLCQAVARCVVKGWCSATTSATPTERPIAVGCRTSSARPCWSTAHRGGSTPARGAFALFASSPLRPSQGFAQRGNVRFGACALEVDE